MKRPETPPNTPQHACIAAQQFEHDGHIFNSPEFHCVPAPAQVPQIEPIQFNNPRLPLPLPLQPIHQPNHDPFAAPALPALPPPVIFNGHQYQHLPANLANMVAALPPLPVLP